MSQEYISAFALVLMGILKVFGIETEKGVLEGIIGSILAVWIMIRRKQKGDINVLGVKKS